MTPPDVTSPLTSADTLLILAGGLSLGMVAAGFWLLRAMDRQNLRESRIRSVRHGAAAAVEADPGGASLPVRVLAGIGVLLSRSRLLPASTLEELEQTLVSAGLRGSNALGLFIGGKLVLIVLLPLGAFVILQNTDLSAVTRMMCIAFGATVGLLLPDFILRRRRSKYLTAVSRGLPDALDMLVICSEAGLGLEAGLERVASETQLSHAAISAELRLTSGELRILADRRIALTNMGKRTGLDSLKRLAATLIQTLQYGTPLSQALRTLSSEMRYEALMRFEAKAARLPVLLTVPMILFILPCTFIIVGGPAALMSVRTLANH